MNRRTYSLFSVFAITLLGFFTLAQCTTQQNEQQPDQEPAAQAQTPPELADYMGSLQRYTHKYTLALDAKNKELAQFYFHEVRATVDAIKLDIPGYEGYDIRRFTTLFLDPTIEPVEEALAGNNWELMRERTIKMIDACNSCHNATSHGFVQITPGFDTNPYNQDFSPKR